MATKKRNRKRTKSRRRNSTRTASVRTAQALVPYRASSPARRSNPKRRRRAVSRRRGRRNPGIIRARRNPLGGGKILGLFSINDVIGGAAGYVGDELVSLLVAGLFGMNPNAVAGLGIRGVGVFAMGKWLPKAYAPAAVVVSSTKIVVSIDDTYLGLRRKLIGTAAGFIPAQAGANSNGGGGQQQPGY